MKASRKQRRFVLGLALGLVAASVVASPAQARPDDLDGTLADVSGTAQPVRPDDQASRISPVADDAAVAGPAVQSTQSNAIPNVPDGRSAHRTFGGGAQALPVTSDDGLQIDLRDAGFGALGATALFALVAGMALAIRHNRHGNRLATS